ncbi:MAG: sigma-70 family RNA polymerase sigma factor [Candidatus Hydrogenedentes bacterium]|nr:sigma-70 family RNA polymerase sigma factor [Candidatus Hydrogenedentota bacterium]
MARIPDYRFLERSFEPAMLDKYANENSLWHETPEEKLEGLRAGRRRQRKLAIVRRAIEEHLTEKQQLCLREHFFEGKSMRKIAAEQGIHFTTVAQHINAGLRRLRKELL